MNEFKFSLDTARPPDDIHDDDGLDTLPNSSHRPPVMMGFVIARVYHGRDIRHINAFNFTIHTTNVQTTLDTLAESGQIPHPYDKPMPWAEVPNQALDTHRATWFAECLTPNCPRRWYADVIVSFASVTDLITE
jgi:hypothetical protein